MKVLTMFFASAVAVTSFGQLADKRIEQALQIPDLSTSESEIEIRLFSDVSLSTQDNYVWIRKINGSWNATSYMFINDSRIDSFKLKKVYSEKLRKNWDTEIKKLLGRDISSYVDQHQLHDKLIAAHQATYGKDSYFMITDGVGYTLTIKMGETTRAFSLHSPEAYSVFFEKFPELKWYSDLLELIDKNVRVKVRG